MAKHGSGIGSQLNQKSPVWRKVKSDRSTMPNIGAGALLDIPVGREAVEKAHEEGQICLHQYNPTLQKSVNNNHRGQDQYAPS